MGLHPFFQGFRPRKTQSTQHDCMQAMISHPYKCYVRKGNWVAKRPPVLLMAIATIASEQGRMKRQRHTKKKTYAVAA